jgi:hypothetical protein
MECHPERQGMAGNGMAGNGMSQGWARNRMVRRRVRHEVSLRRTWQGRKRRPRGIEELLEQNRFGWVCHSKRPSRDKGVVRVVSGEFVARCETTRGDSSSGGPGCSRVCRRVGKRSERHGRERPPVSKGWGWWGTSHDAYREGLSIGQARTGEGTSLVRSRPGAVSRRAREWTGAGTSLGKSRSGTSLGRIQVGNVTWNELCGFGLSLGEGR